MEQMAFNFSEQGHALDEIILLMSKQSKCKTATYHLKKIRTKDQLRKEIECQMN